MRAQIFKVVVMVPLCLVIIFAFSDQATRSLV